jgi:hypothetical protein
MLTRFSNPGRKRPALTWASSLSLRSLESPELEAIISIFSDREYMEKMSAQLLFIKSLQVVV